MNLDNQSAVLLVESDSVDSIEQLFEVVLNSIRIRALRENLEQVSIGAEVETGEHTSLLFEIAVKLFLAFL